MQGAGHKQGPNLGGLFGRTAGTTEGFAYSAANKGSGESMRISAPPEKQHGGRKGEIVGAGLSDLLVRDSRVGFVVFLLFEILCIICHIYWKEILVGDAKSVLYRLKSGASQGRSSVLFADAERKGSTV
jgi:hypothetical protein